MGSGYPESGRGSIPQGWLFDSELKGSNSHFISACSSADRAALAWAGRWFESNHSGWVLYIWTFIPLQKYNWHLGKTRRSASVAQWQRNWFVINRLWVRVSPLAGSTTKPSRGATVSTNWSKQTAAAQFRWTALPLKKNSHPWIFTTATFICGINSGGLRLPC